ICSRCEERRQEWLAWSRTSRPATNFSGWTDRPLAPQTCIALGGGWATRVASRRDPASAGSDALTPVFYWLELRVIGEREILVTALTMHRRQGCLRFRELRLRTPTGRPTAELDFQLTRAANDFATAAQKFRQRLARAEPAQLTTWLTQASHAAPVGTSPLPPVKPAPSQISNRTAPPSAKVAADTKSAPARHQPSKFTPTSEQHPHPSANPAEPAPPSRRIARWIDRLANQAADWLEQRES
ncbi:MAG TPA: hypothetical protein VL860_00930, partial [Planctomycetota bacterium]|nr:hypothetical protein [Planctomycetota bacterium]